MSAEIRATFRFKLRLLTGIGKGIMAKKVMFVEPDAVKRDGFSKVFDEGTRYQLAMSVGKGDQVVQAIERSKPDVLILSLDTPYTAQDGKGGVLGLLIEILDLSHPPRVIAYCNDTTRELWPKAKRLGALALISDTFSRAEVMETIRKIEETGRGMDALRRHRLRLRAHMVGWYKKPGDGFFKKMDPATIVDISGSGVGISTVENIPVGTNLKLNLTLPPQKKPIKTNADVVWTEPVKRQYRIGLRFSKMNDVDRERLEIYIASRVDDE
ncbi:MAG: hypothetical protein HON70_23310 [Lentisphaerae bacterium]|jgi:AmiR/NasT family two-component response regulator/Tfp pilus assembly protein PilZ|nr:hypothetical protein [Lentisphaerota bacterium]